MKDVSPKNVYQTQGTQFDKPDSFAIEYTNDQTLLKSLVVFDFESNCVQEGRFKETDTTNLIGKHHRISISISTNILKKSFFLCKSDPDHLVSSFIGAVENLAF